MSLINLLHFPIWKQFALWVYWLSFYSSKICEHNITQIIHNNILTQSLFYKMFLCRIDFYIVSKEDNFNIKLLKYNLFIYIKKKINTGSSCGQYVEFCSSIIMQYCQNNRFVFIKVGHPVSSQSSFSSAWHSGEDATWGVSSVCFI